MKKTNLRKTQELIGRRNAPLATRTDLTPSATKDIAGAMNAILADVFAVFVYWLIICLFPRASAAASGGTCMLGFVLS